MRKVSISFVFVILCFCLYISPVSASFGVSPADLTIDDLRPGMTVEKTFLLSRTDLDKDAHIVVDADIEGADSWIKVDPGISFTIPKGQRTKEMKVIVSVPNDAPYKNYEGYLVVKNTEGEETSGVSVVKGVGIAVNLITTKLEVTKLLVRKLDIQPFAAGETIRLLITTENQGNKDATPDAVKIVVYDMLGNIIFEGEDTSLENIEPGKTQDLVAEFENNLTQGEYKADVFVYFEGELLREEKLVFSVTEGENYFQEPAENNQNSTINLLLYSGIIILVTIVVLLLIRKLYLIIGSKK